MNEADSLLSDSPLFLKAEEFDPLESLVPETGNNDDRQLRRSSRDVGRQRRKRFGGSDSGDPPTSKFPAARHGSRFNTSDLKEEKELRKVVSVKPSMAPVTDIHASYPDWSVLERELEAAKTHENAYFLDSSFLRALTVMDYWLSAEGPFFMPRREFRHRHCIFNLFWQPSAPNWEKSEYVVPPRLDGLLRWYLTRDNFINKEAGNRLQDITSHLPQDTQAALSRRGWSLYIMNMVYQSGNQLIFRKDNEKEYQPYFGSTAKSQLRNSLLPEMSPDLFEALCHRLAPPNLLEMIARLPDLTLGPIPPIEMASVRADLEDYRANELVILRKSQSSKPSGSRKKRVEHDADYVGEDPRPAPSHSNLSASTNSATQSDNHDARDEPGLSGFRSGVGGSTHLSSSSSAGSSVTFKFRGNGVQGSHTAMRGSDMETGGSSQAAASPAHLSRAGRNTSRAMQNLQHRLNDAMEEEELSEFSGRRFDDGGSYFVHQHDHAAGGDDGMLHAEHGHSPSSSTVHNSNVNDRNATFGVGLPGGNVAGVGIGRSGAPNAGNGGTVGAVSPIGGRRGSNDAIYGAVSHQTSSSGAASSSSLYGSSSPSFRDSTRLSSAEHMIVDEHHQDNETGASAATSPSASSRLESHHRHWSDPQYMSYGASNPRAMLTEVEESAARMGSRSSVAMTPTSLQQQAPPSTSDHVGSPFGGVGGVGGSLMNNTDDDLSDLSTSSSSRKRSSGRKDTKTNAKRRKLANSASDHLPSRYTRSDREAGYSHNSREAQRSGSAASFSTNGTGNGGGPSSAASLSPSTSSTSLATVTDLHQLENSFNSSIQLLQRTITGLFGKLQSVAHQHSTSSHHGSSFPYNLASTLDLSILQDRIYHSIQSLASVQLEYDQLGQTIDSVLATSSHLPIPSSSHPSLGTTFSSPLHVNVAESQSLTSRWPVMNHLGAFSIPYPHHHGYAGSKLAQGSVDNGFYDISSAESFHQQQGSLQNRNDVSHSFGGPVPFFSTHPLNSGHSSFLSSREMVSGISSASTNNQGPASKHEKLHQNISSGDGSNSGSISTSGPSLGSVSTSSSASASANPNAMPSGSPLPSPSHSHSGTHSSAGEASKRSPGRSSGENRSKKSGGVRNGQTSHPTPVLLHASSNHSNDMSDASGSDHHYTTVHSESSHTGRQTISYDWTSASPFLHPSTGAPLPSQFMPPTSNMNNASNNLLGSSTPLPYFTEPSSESYTPFPRLYSDHPHQQLQQLQQLHPHHYANSALPTGTGTLPHHVAFPTLHSTPTSSIVGSPPPSGFEKKELQPFY